MKKILLTYGIIFGITQILSTIFMYERVLGIYQLAGISFLLTIVVLVLAIQQYKKSNEGFASFQNILKLTLGVYVIGLVIGLVVGQLYVATKSEEWKQEFVSKYVEDQISTLQGFGLEETDEMEEEMIKVGETLFDVKTSLIGSVNGLFFVIIIFVILGLIFKKDPPQIST